MSVETLSERSLAASDPAVAGLIEAEIAREPQTICLIPSENYVSRAVLEAMGSVFTNKYSEGYSGRRYYEGQQVVDRLEPLAIERAELLFGVDHANVFRQSGERVLAICRQRAKGRQGGVAVEMPVYAVWTFRADQVVGLHWLRDRDEELREAGLAAQRRALRNVAPARSRLFAACGCDGGRAIGRAAVPPALVLAKGPIREL